MGELDWREKMSTQNNEYENYTINDLIQKQQELQVAWNRYQALFFALVEDKNVSNEDIFALITQLNAISAHLNTVTNAIEALVNSHSLSSADINAAYATEISDEYSQQNERIDELRR